MVGTIGSAKHAVGIVHEVLWWGEMDLRPERTGVVAGHWDTSRYARIEVFRLS